MRKQPRMKDVVEAMKALANLPPPSPSPHQLVSKIEAIKELLEVLESARARGHSYEQLSAALLRHHIEIKPSTLKGGSPFPGDLTAISAAART